MIQPGAGHLLPVLRQRQAAFLFPQGKFGIRRFGSGEFPLWFHQSLLKASYPAAVNHLLKPQDSYSLLFFKKNGQQRAPYWQTQSMLSQ
jgi:hypothetical protein